jgi:trehalose-6-phosphate synthase
MGLDERRARHHSLMEVVQRSDVTAWCRSFLGMLQGLHADDPMNWPPSQGIEQALQNLRQLPIAADPRKTGQQLSLVGTRRA